MNEMIDILIAGQRFLWGIHIFGIVLGLGAATVADIMFFRFLKNFRILSHEAKTMETLSIVVWVGLALLIVSGIALYWPMAQILFNSPRFLMKMTLVGVIIINGFILNRWIQPRIRKVSFVEKEGQSTPVELRERERIRRIAFISGAVSVVSWYGAFALAVLNMITISYWSLVIIYLSILIVAVVGSQFKERQVLKKASTSLEHDEQLVT